MLSWPLVSFPSWPPRELRRKRLVSKLDGFLSDSVIYCKSNRQERRWTHVKWNLKSRKYKKKYKCWAIFCYQYDCIFSLSKKSIRWWWLYNAHVPNRLTKDQCERKTRKRKLFTFSRFIRSSWNRPVVLRGLVLHIRWSHSLRIAICCKDQRTISQRSEIGAGCGAELDTYMKEGVRRILNPPCCWGNTSSK